MGFKKTNHMITMIFLLTKLSKELPSYVDVFLFSIHNVCFSKNNFHFIFNFSFLAFPVYYPDCLPIDLPWK